MTAIPIKQLPTAVLSDMDVLREAVTALQEHDRLRAAMRANELTLRTLCRQYDAATGTRMFQPHHLRYACEARGLMNRTGSL